MDNQNNQEPQNTPSPQPVTDAGVHPPAQPHQLLTLQPSRSAIDELKAQINEPATPSQQTATPPTPQAPVAPPLPQNVPTITALGAVPPRKATFGVIKLLVILLVIIIIGAGGYALLRHSSTPKKNPTATSKTPTTQSQTTPAQSSNSNSTNPQSNNPDNPTTNPQIQQDVNTCKNSPLVC